MKRTCIFVLLLLLLLISAKGYCELDGPIAKEALKRETLSLLYASQFKELEEKAKRYSAKKERFPDGTWKLYPLFNAFESPPCKSDEEWKKHLRFLEAWQTEYPASNAANTALAGAWMGYAWFARGLDFRIKSGGYPDMVARLGKAEKILKKVSNSYVPALDLRLQLALANCSPKKEFEALLKRALTVEPSYVAFYSAAINYYLPRWHGAPGEWVKKLERFDRTAPRKEGIYVRVAFGFQGIEWEKFSEGTIKWTKMKKSLAGIGYDSPWIDNMAASYACLAGDYDTARRLLNKIGPNIYYAAWRYGNAQECKRKVGLSDDFTGFAGSMDYRYMEELSRSNQQWASELLRKWKKYNMVGHTYETEAGLH